MSGLDPLGGGSVTNDGDTRRIVGLCAICDLGTLAPQDGSQSFEVAEAAVLATGDRIRLRELGWTTSSRGAPHPHSLTTQQVVQEVLNVVLPDEDDEHDDDHPWEELASLCRARDLEANADLLKTLPYHVLLTDRVLSYVRAQTP